MPCYDARDHDPEAARAEGYSKAQREFTHNSPVAELLCWTISDMYLSDRARLLSSNPALAKWWRDHQKRDAKKAKR